MDAAAFQQQWDVHQAASLRDMQRMYQRERNAQEAHSFEPERFDDPAEGGAPAPVIVSQDVRQAPPSYASRPYRRR